MINDSLVRSTSRWAFVLATLFAASACSSGTASRAEDDTPGPDPSGPVTPIDPKPVAPPVNVGPRDDGIEVMVPQLPAGNYRISITSVDGERVWRSVDEQADPSRDVSLVANLPLPEFESQAGLVEWNLVIERLDDGEATELVLLQSLLYFLEPFEVQLEGPGRVTTDKEVAYRVRARHPMTLAGLPDRAVALDVKREDEVIERVEGITDELGVAVLKLSVAQAGGVSVEASADGAVISARVSETIQVEATSSKLMLTTDKPIYKPGQTIQLRALALSRTGNTPVAQADAVFEVEDGKGNKIFKKTLKTDAYGIAATPFRIGNVVNEGAFKLRASVGDSVSEKTVEVSQYALPKFRLSTRTNDPWYLPGSAISGVVDAQYFFGKSVQGGSVVIEAATLDIGRNVYQRVMGQTNAAGSFEFSLNTPSTLVGLPLEGGQAVIQLDVTVTDTAGQQVSATTLVRVAQHPIELSLVPEGTTLVLGIPNRVNAFVTDPLGAPLAGATIALHTQDETLSATANAYGHAVFEWVPSDGDTSVFADVSHGSVELDELRFDFTAQEGTTHVLVRTDKSVYDVGESVLVEVLTSDDEGSVFVDWLNQGQAVDARSLEPENGSASFSFDLDAALLGHNRVEAYVVDTDGNLVRAGRTVFVRNASSLNVEIETDQQQYEPGAPATLSFSVTDESGAPTVAALGVQIVDEAVFSLIDARPGLLNTYFELEDSFAQPSYQLKAPPVSLPTLIFERPNEANARFAVQSKAEAAFAALGSMALTGLQAHSWPAVVNEGNTLLAPYFDSEKRRVVELANGQLGAAVRATLDAGCSLDEYWCERRSSSFVEVMFEELGTRVRAVDFWRNAYAVKAESRGLSLRTRGPDEVADNADDRAIAINVSDLDLSRSPELVEHTREHGGDVDAGIALPPDIEWADDGAISELPGAFDPNAPAPEPGPVTQEPSEEDGTSAPRVRSEFPETLYWNPAVITDASGRASIELSLADSITQWRISTLANSSQGKLGSSVGAMTVFQDFFVDVSFPATLTRGDEVSFPIAVYNYLDTPQTVQLELEPASWYTALGETALSIELAAGEVRGVSVPVRVEEVGFKTLTVHGLGSQKSDAVARGVKVLPDGKQISLAQSGSVADTVTHPVSFDPASIPGSEELYLNVFPTFLSQAVQGLDSMLQVPSGCFEQTTANAWPNVLVTHYMKETDQITPEILLKAESLMSAGYQRLLTFEHPGGGFSWFGVSDGKPFLSVTAFGLMEFSDMAKVHHVDEAMLARTLAYLLSQQKADGSWDGDTSEFFSFHTSSLRNTAFTLMAVGSSGYTGPEVTRAVDFLKSELSSQSVDAYTLAMVANALALTAPNDPRLAQVLGALAEMAVPDAQDDTVVSWDTGNTQTMFYGYGNDAEVTTTALVVHAMLLDGGYPDLVSKGLNKLAASKDSLGNFGSTQATVWTLKTLLLAATKGTSAAIGSLFVEVDGEVVHSLELTEDQSDVMTTVDLAAYASGQRQISLTFSGEGKASYNLVSNYNVPWNEAPVEAEGPLSVAIAYDRTRLQLDELVTASVTVRNNTSNTQNMALVTVGLPPGFELQREDFAPYLANGSLSRFELTGKQLILYVSELAPNVTLEFRYGLRATMPVRASDGGSSVHLYYQPDLKSKAQEQTLEVLPPS